MTRLPQEPCRGCGAAVVHVVDVDTGEPIVLDAERVDEGNVAVYSLRRHAFARRYGRPARVQPAHREHECPTPTLSTPSPAEDPYSDLSAAAQQHGGWRA